MHAKITGAALAAAFAAKKKDGAPAEELTIAQKEEQVVVAIRKALDAGPAQPRECFSALGDFGKASGDLAQSWLTPQQLERCAFFWGGGSTMLARDLRRGKLSFVDLKASPWFGLLALNTFPWTPLLVPLVARAVNSTEGSRGFVPLSYSEGRLKALQRLRGDGGLEDVSTPQTIDEGVRFFSDGWRMLLRDWRRGRLMTYGDTKATYGWFAFLSLSTFPLTPLLLPIIDKRRAGVQSDYVPTQFQARRLAAFSRYRASTATTAREPSRTIRAALAGRASSAGASAAAEVVQVPPGELLDAIVGLRAAAHTREHFLEHLAGGGSPGREWTLVYVAGKQAVKEARQRRRGLDDSESSGARPPPPAWLTASQRVLLPWTRLADGVYVDGFVTAVQRFDAQAAENENGVRAVLGAEWARFSVRGPFKWAEPRRRSVCAFQPTLARYQLGNVVWETPLSPDVPFEHAPVTKLPFFKFLLVDDEVAVAQGRSGSVAVWARRLEEA